MGKRNREDPLLMGEVAFDSGGQFEMESPASVGKSENVDSSGDTLESIGSSDESVRTSEKSRGRGKDLNWQPVERFENQEAFNRSQIKAKIENTQMYRKLQGWESMGARNSAYACNVYRKQGWKSCPRKYRVSLLSTTISPCH